MMLLFFQFCVLQTWWGRWHRSEFLLCSTWSWAPPPQWSKLFKDGGEDYVLQQNSIFGRQDETKDGKSVLFFLFCLSGAMLVGLNLLIIACRCSHFSCRLVTARTSFQGFPQIHLRQKKKPQNYQILQRSLFISPHWQEALSLQDGRRTQQDIIRLAASKKKTPWKTKYGKYDTKFSGCIPNGTVSTSFILSINFFILNFLQAS